MSERTVLITGATGAVGGAVVDAMLEAGWHVVATWVVPEERERMQEREGLELVQADLLHEREVADAVTQAAFGAGRAARGREPGRRLRRRGSAARDRRSRTSRSCSG